MSQEVNQVGEIQKHHQKSVLLSYCVEGKIIVQTVKSDILNGMKFYCFAPRKLHLVS